MGKEMRDMVKKENSYCSWVGTFGTESAVRKRGGSRNLPYLNAKPRQIPLLDTYACTVTNQKRQVGYGTGSDIWRKNDRH